MGFGLKESGTLLAGIGALNLGLAQVAKFNLVETIIPAQFVSFVYIGVGIAGGYLLYQLFS